MNIVYTYSNKSAFLVEYDDPRNDISRSKAPPKRRYYVLFMPQVNSDADITSLSVSKFSPLLKAHRSCSELAQIIFKSFDPSNVEAVADLDSYWNPTSPQTPAAVISTAFSALPLAHCLNSSDDVNTPNLKYYLLSEFLPESFFHSQKDEHHRFSFWNMFLCVMYAVTFDSAVSITNSYFCLGQYLLRSSSDSKKSKTAESHSVAAWNEEFLWRLINALLSTLAVVHTAGLHFGGQIAIDNIVCFAIPKKLSAQLENAFNRLQDEISHREWGADVINTFLHTINSSIILPSAPITAQTPVYRAFFTLTTTPRGVLSKHTDASSDNELYQHRDLNCVGNILLAITEAQKASNPTADTLVSSELKFFIRQMCGSFSPSSPTATAPSVLYLTRLQALRLRANSWIHCLLAEETHLLARRYLHSHKSQCLSLCEGANSEGQKSLDIQQEEVTLEKKNAELTTYANEINERAMTLESRENAVLIREKKLEAMLALYELTYSHLDALPDAESAGYSELRRQLCGQFVEKNLHSSVKADHSPSLNPVPSPKFQLATHVDHTQHRFMKDNEVDDRNDASSLTYHHLNDLSDKTTMSEASSQMIRQPGSKSHFILPVPPDKSPLNNLNQISVEEPLEKFSLNTTKPKKGIKMNQQSTPTLQNQHATFFPSQAAPFHSAAEGAKLFLAKDVEPCVTKSPSPRFSRSTTPQQLALDRKSNIDNIPKALPGMHDSVPLFPPSTVTDTSYTPLKTKTMDQEKPSSGSLLYSPPPLLRPDGQSLFFQRPGEAIIDNSPFGAHTNGETETGETSKGCVEDFRDDDKCNSHCTPKRPILETLDRKDQSACSKSSAALSNLKAERMVASNNSTDIDATPEHAGLKTVSVPKLSGVLVNTETFPIPVTSEPKGEDNQLKTPCTGVSDSQDSMERQPYREFRTTRVKGELDQNWAQLHYAELEKMQNNFRHDSGPGRNANTARSARMTPRNLKAVRGGHHLFEPVEGRSDPSKGVDTSMEGISDTNLASKHFIEKNRLVEHQEGRRGCSITSPQIEVVTEEALKCVGFTLNKSLASPHRYPVVSDLFPHSHAQGVAHEQNPQHSTPLSDHAAKLSQSPTCTRIKQKTRRETVSTTQKATLSSGAPLFTPSASSLLNLYVTEKYPSKEHSQKVKNYIDSHKYGTNSTKRCSSSSVAPKLTSRKNLNSTSPSLASSQTPSSAQLQRHTEPQRHLQGPLASPRQKAKNMQHPQLTSANALSNVINQTGDVILNNTSEAESLKRQKFSHSEHSVRAPSTENTAFRTPRRVEGASQVVSSRRGPPPQPAGTSPNSVKNISESLKSNRNCIKANSVDDAAQDLLKRLRNNVALTP